MIFFRIKNKFIEELGKIRNQRIKYIIDFKSLKEILDIIINYFGLVMDSFDIFLNSQNYEQSHFKSHYDIEDSYLMGIEDAVKVGSNYDRSPKLVKGYYCPVKNMFFIIE